MKIVLLLVGVQLVACQYGPLPARKLSRPPPDSVNEIVPPDNPQDHGLNGLAPGVHPLNKATSFWWSGPQSPFRPEGAVQIGSQQPDNRPAFGCPPGGCGAPSCSPGQPGCSPSTSGSNSFLGQGYGQRPGQPPASGNPPTVPGNQQPSGGIPPPSSSQTIDKPIDISSNPFLSSALQKPVPSSQDACQAQDTFCVPSNFCYNGIITDNDPNLPYKYKKGPCTGNELCCRKNYSQSSGGSLPSNAQFPGSQPGSNLPGSQTSLNNQGHQSHIPGTQPSSQFPSTQPGSQYPGTQGSQYPGTQGSQYPGAQGSYNPGTQGPQFPDSQSQTGPQFPGTQTGAHFPSNQPQSGSQYPSGSQSQTSSQFQPGNQFPSFQPQPGSQSQFPNNQPQPGSQVPNNQHQPGSQFPNNQPQPGSQFPNNQPRPGSQSPNNQPQPGSQFPGSGPGIQFPNNQFPGTQTGSQYPGVRPNYDGSSTKYTGPLNTTPPPGCAAALKCVAEIYCTVEGVMSNTPVQLTREQLANKVPLSDCQDLETGLIGKCCRDPNYKDPWPAGMMMAKGQGQFDDGLYKGNPNSFDDGQYRPEHQEPVNPGYQQQPTSIPNRTIKKPLGVFNTVVTPFPVVLKPQPGQTHSQVFPQNEDKLAGSSGLSPGQGIQQPGQGGFTSPGQPSYQNPNLQGQPQPNFPGSPVSFHPGTSAGSSNQLPGQSSQFPQNSFNQQPGVIPNSPSINVQPGSTSNFPTNFPGQFLPGVQSVGQHPQSPSQPTGSPQQSFPNTPSYGSSGQKQFPPPFPGSPSLTSQQTSPPQQIPQVIPGQECGVRRPPFTDNVDVNSANGEFPWQAIVLSSKNNSALCSGAIISDNAILTSAHCLEGFDAQDLQVKVGTWRLNEPGNTQVSKVAAIVPHPSFDSGSLAKDQAVLALEQPLVFNQNVDKVCLPPADKDHYTQNGKTCYITGWGRPNLQGGLSGTILHKMEVNLIPNNQCENTLKQTYLGKYFVLNDAFTCALPKYGGEFCKVDIGSPLVCDRGDGHYELAGVYSWDTQCSSQAPAVLTECDSQWTQQVLNTPVDTLKAQQYKPKFETSRPEDIDRKPGFALGYGK